MTETHDPPLAGAPAAVDDEPTTAPETGTVAGAPWPWPGGARPAWPEWLGLAALLAAVAVLATIRWTGHPPFGSDNDEYRMLAGSLWTTGEPLIGGVEATKYPFGYAWFLGGLDRLGLDMTAAALGLNVALVALAVVVVWLAARTRGAVAGAVAGAVVVASATLWDSVYVVMPDLALLVTTALALLLVLALPAPPWRTDAAPHRGIVPGLLALALLAPLLKTVGVILSGMIGVALVARRRTRVWGIVAVIAGLAVTVGQAAAVSGYPEHTTGYAATFWQVDPSDASRGTIGWGGLAQRTVDRIDLFLTDAGRVLVPADAPAVLGIVAIVSLLAVAVVAYRRARWSMLAFTLVYVVVLAAWPFRSPRFGLPLLPLAAVGAGALSAAVARRASRGVAATLVVLLLVPYGAWNVQRLTGDMRGERRELSLLHAAMADLEPWVEANIAPEDDIASFDYRELAYRLDRIVLPMGYTTSPEALWAMSGGRGADWLIAIKGLYARRSGLAGTLVRAYPDRFERVYTDDRIDVYRIHRPAGTP